MEFKHVFYSRQKNGLFNVVIDNKNYVFYEHDWDSFLDSYGTNPKSKDKRISGTDSVDLNALNDFIENDRRHGF